MQSILRVFVFCSADEKTCEEWIEAIRAGMAGNLEEFQLRGGMSPGEKEGVEVASWSWSKQVSQASVAAKSPRLDIGTPTTQGTNPDSDGEKHEEKRASLSVSGVTSMVADRTIATYDRMKVKTDIMKVTATLAGVKLLSSLREPVSDIAAMLMDSTRARRWKNSRRLVLNDRLLVTDWDVPPPPSITQAMLEAVLKLNAQPDMSAFIAFLNDSCLLKAVRFNGWTQSELLAFWLNLYHCLLLHGFLVLGRPTTKREIQRFHGRVSYLVGPRPVSLREVERVILKVQKGDPKGAARAQARLARTCVYIYIYIYTYLHTYTYIYIERERDRYV